MTYVVLKNVLIKEPTVKFIKSY